MAILQKLERMIPRKRMSEMTATKIQTIWTSLSVKLHFLILCNMPMQQSKIDNKNHSCNP